MKKIIMLAFMGMTAMSFSRGLNFKGGFDFDRTLTGKEISKSSQGKGFVLGLEGIAFDSKYVNLGLGAEYNGGLYLNKYDTQINDEASTKAYTIPIYGLIQANAYKDKIANVYPFARLGYAVSKLDNKQDLSGVYYGLGLGVNVKNFIFEGLYDGIYGNKEKVFTHKIGVRLGYSLDFDKMGLFDKKPEMPKPVKKEVVKKVEVVKKEEPVKKEEVKPISETIKLVAPEKVGVYDLSNLTQDEKIEVAKAIKQANPNVPFVEMYIDKFGNVVLKYKDESMSRISSENTVYLKEKKVEKVEKVEVVKKGLPTSCAIDYKECVIHGFKVDGKKPSIEEEKALEEIAKIVNEHAVNGVVNIVGYTDSIGSEEYNQRLSEQRAQNVANLLRRNGLKEEIKFGLVTGKGENDPVDTNKTKKGRYNNRRVVLTFDNLDVK